MRTNYQVNAAPLFRVLSDDQIEDIYLSALQLLERAGTRVLDEDGLRLLREAGCQVSDANLVRIPSWLIKSSLATAPERITLAGRDRSRRITLERNKTYFGTGSDCPFILDPHTDERRRPTLEDLRHAAIVSEASPNIDFHMSLGLASDLPISSCDGRQLLAMLQGTAKPLVVTATGEDGLADQYELACRVLGIRRSLPEPLSSRYTSSLTLRQATPGRR